MGAQTDEAARAVEERVAHYQAKARAVARASVALGATAGVLVGAVPLSPLRAAWPIPSSFGFATRLGGLVVGVLIGYVVGDPRAKLYQRMAEQARLQLQLEQRISQNDARMAQLLTALTARAVAAAQRAQAPQPQPQPVQVQHQPVQTQPLQPQPVQAQPVQPASQPHLVQVPAVAPPQAAPAIAPPLSPPVSG